MVISVQFTKSLELSEYWCHFLLSYGPVALKIRLRFGVDDGIFVADSNLLGRVLVRAFPDDLSHEIRITEHFVANLPQVRNFSIVD